MTIKLHIGFIGRTRNGDVVKIGRNENDGKYSFKGDNGYRYAEDGTCNQTYQWNYEIIEQIHPADNMALEDESRRNCINYLKHKFTSWKRPAIELPAESVIEDVVDFILQQYKEQNND